MEQWRDWARDGPALVSESLVLALPTLFLIRNTHFAAGEISGNFVNASLVISMTKWKQSGWHRSSC